MKNNFVPLDVFPSESGICVGRLVKTHKLVYEVARLDSEAIDYARLFAAAPDLLSALQSLIQYLPEEEIHYEDASAYRQIQRAVERAEAAIAKATQISSSRA